MMFYHRTPTSGNCVDELSPLVLDALAADLAVMGITAPPSVLLRYVIRQNRVVRPKLSGDADGPHR